MLGHVHVLLWFPKIGQLSRFMQQWKGRSSKVIKEVFVALGAGVCVEVVSVRSHLAGAVLLVRDLHDSQD
jgi:REP element-mobilizing transposase RayT